MINIGKFNFMLIASFFPLEEFRLSEFLIANELQPEYLFMSTVSVIKKKNTYLNLIELIGRNKLRQSLNLTQSNTLLSLPQWSLQSQNNS